MTEPITVFLVPAGGERFELYSEAPEEPGEAPGQHESRFRHWAHRASIRWQALTDAARRGGAERGRCAGWRDAIVCRLAETIAEQRTLWALRDKSSATVRCPSTLDVSLAQAVLSRLLAHARRDHLRWFIIDS